MELLFEAILFSQYILIGCVNNYPHCGDSNFEKAFWVSSLKAELNSVCSTINSSLCGVVICLEQYSKVDVGFDKHHTMKFLSYVDLNQHFHVDSQILVSCDIANKYLHLKCESIAQVLVDIIKNHYTDWTNTIVQSANDNLYLNILFVKRAADTIRHQVKDRCVVGDEIPIAPETPCVAGNNKRFLFQKSEDSGIDSTVQNKRKLSSSSSDEEDVLDTKYLKLVINF